MLFMLSRKSRLARISVSFDSRSVDQDMLSYRRDASTSPAEVELPQLPSQ
jgi:hypothetical protein